MRADRFDDISRSLFSGYTSGTRRSLLRAIGLGGAGLSLGGAGLSVGARAVGALPGGSPSATRSGAQTATVGEVDELAFELDYDIDRMFRFVRDEVVYDPYPGILRGAKGTMWGLAGNAVDQAILLAALLEAGLVQTRFVVGTLSEDAASTLIEAATLDAATMGARNDRLLASADATVAETPTLTADQEAFVGKFVDFSDQVVGIIDGHVADGIETVVEALARAGVELPAPQAALPDEERLRHIWVQYASGSDWIDLDPSMPGAEPGESFASDPTALDALPEELHHRVAIRLVAEQVVGGGVVRADLLTFDAPSSDLVGSRLTLMHPEPDALTNIGIAISGLLDGYRNYVPTLLVDDETIVGDPVTFGTGGGVLDPLGGEAVDGDTLAEWMEITVTTPIGSETATRTVFDRVGAEAREAGPVDVSTIAPVDLSAEGDGVLTPSSAWMLAVVTGIVPEAVVPKAPAQNATMEDALPALLAYHHARELSIGRVPTLEGCRLFYDAPNVTAFVQQPVTGAPDGATTAFGMDLLHRSVAVAPGAGAATVHPLVAAGVLAHAVEMAIFESGELEPLNLGLGAPMGTLRVFAEAKAQGIEVVTLLPEASGTELLAVAAAARASIERALAAGQIVIVPSRPVTIDGRERVGAWLVDPVTGVARDQMDNESGGAFQTLPEKALLIRIVCVAAGFYAALTIVYAIRVAQAGGLAGNDGLAAVGGLASGVGAAAGCGLAA